MSDIQRLRAILEAKIAEEPAMPIADLFPAVPPMGERLGGPENSIWRLRYVLQIFEGFKAMPAVMSQDEIESKAAGIGFVMGYLFTVGAASLAELFGLDARDTQPAPAAAEPPIAVPSIETQVQAAVEVLEAFAPELKETSYPIPDSGGISVLLDGPSYAAEALKGPLPEPVAPELQPANFPAPIDSVTEAPPKLLHSSDTTIPIDAAPARPAWLENVTAVPSWAVPGGPK